MIPRENTRVFLVVATLLSLGACARSDVASLRADPGTTYEFRVNLSFDKAFELARAGFTRCLTGSIFRNTMAIHAEFDRDHGTATIIYREHSLTSGYWATVDFTAAGSQTAVKVGTISNPGISKLGPEVEQWLAGSQECHIGGFVGQHYPIEE